MKTYTEVMDDPRLTKLNSEKYLLADTLRALGPNHPYSKTVGDALFDVVMAARVVEMELRDEDTRRKLSKGL